MNNQKTKVDKIQRRQSRIEHFINSIFSSWGEIKTEVSVNDDSDTEYTDFEVKISNSTNAKVLYQVLRCNNILDIELLLGEDFHQTSESHFCLFCFYCLFTTSKEI